MFAGGALLMVALIVALGGGLTHGTGWIVDQAAFIAPPLLLGALLLCLRRRVVLDRRQRVAVAGWSLLVPLTTREHRLSSAHEVVLASEERSFGDTDYNVFPVTLEGPGSDVIRLREPRNHERARRLAEDTAKFLGLGMRDRSSAPEIVRAAGTLDQPLRERAQRSGVRPRLPERPAAARSVANLSGSGATIEIPPYLHWKWSLLIGFLVAALTALLIEFDTKRNAPPELEHWLLVLFVLLGAMVPVFLFAVQRWGIHSTQRLVVSPHEVVLTRRGLWGARTLRLPAGEIEEVVTEPGAGEAQRVVIRGDRGSLKLALVRSEEEARWLRDVLVYALTAS